MPGRQRRGRFRARGVALVPERAAVRPGEVVCYGAVGIAALTLTAAAPLTCGCRNNDALASDPIHCTAEISSTAISSRASWNSAQTNSRRCRWRCRPRARARRQRPPARTVWLRRPQRTVATSSRWCGTWRSSSACTDGGRGRVLHCALYNSPLKHETAGLARPVNKKRPLYREDCI